MNAQFHRHAAARRKLVRAFEDALVGRSDGLGVVDDCSVAFDDASVPQPDITLTLEPLGDGPVPLASLRLVVEVADTTVAEDMRRKQRLYARHGIPEYWVADVVANRLVRMWAPKGDGYAQRNEQAFGMRMESARIAGVAIESAGVR